MPLSTGVPRRTQLPDNNGGASVPSKALKRNAADINSSDDDDFNPTAAVALKSRRLIFQGSKNAKKRASMPTESKAPHTEATPQNRRASLTHNLKILAITITPPTPEMVELSSDSDEDVQRDHTLMTSMRKGGSVVFRCF